MDFSEYTDPFTLFTNWYAEVQRTPTITEKTAMSVATATKDGAPSVRILLLKEYDTKGFVFYTNLESRKSQEIKENPKAALCFFWMPLEKQVRIEGSIEPVSDESADAYFNSRPLKSRISALASQQSRPLDSRDTLMKRVKDLEQQYSESNPPPRPKHWSGWRVVPTSFEFWQQHDYRLHNRVVFTRNGTGWNKKLLYP